MIHGVFSEVFISLIWIILSFITRFQCRAIIICMQVFNIISDGYLNIPVLQQKIYFLAYQLRSSSGNNCMMGVPPFLQNEVPHARVTAISLRSCFTGVDIINLIALVCTESVVLSEWLNIIQLSILILYFIQGKSVL